jgi:hypothetical protein
MSDTDSDDSINTEELNEIIETKKQDTVGGVERSSEKKEKKVKKEVQQVQEEVQGEVEEIKEKIKPQKREPKARTPAQIAATERLVAANKAKREAKVGKVVVVDGKEDVMTVSDIGGNEVPVKKKRTGRPKTHTKEVVLKEKVVYMVQDTHGNFVESKPPKPLTKTELKKIENEKKSKQDEVELGRKLIRKKNGTTDMRSKNTRTPAQIEASKRLVELNKKRRDDRLKAQKEQLSETIKETVIDSMVDVVTKPISEIKERKVNRKIITDEERKAHEFKKLKNLFS